MIYGERFRKILVPHLRPRFNYFLKSVSCTQIKLSDLFIIGLRKDQIAQSTKNRISLTPVSNVYIKTYS